VILSIGLSIMCFTNSSRYQPILPQYHFDGYNGQLDGLFEKAIFLTGGVTITSAILYPVVDHTAESYNGVYVTPHHLMSLQLITALGRF
jgi:hypothetical protein